jgi:hypothetical protein
MKVKVFQLQQKKFDSEGNIIPKDKRKNKIVCIGTVIVPKNKKDFIEEAIWDLFNWTCWNWGKLIDKSWIYGIRNGIRRDGFRMFPTRKAKGFCNSDIFFKLEDKWMIAKSFGWDKANSYEEAVRIVINQQF